MDYSLDKYVFFFCLSKRTKLDLEKTEPNSKRLEFLILFISGGCATFGHSCYGGMGKRASEFMGTNEEIMQDVVAQDGENPAFVFTGPRSAYKPEPTTQRLTPQQYDNISRVIRLWVRQLI